MWDREVVRGERYGSKKTCDDEGYCGQTWLVD